MGDEEVNPMDFTPLGKMWTAMSKEAIAWAIESAKQHDWETAAMAGRYAEAFHWRATGDHDSFDLANEKLP